MIRITIRIFIFLSSLWITQKSVVSGETDQMNGYFSKLPLADAFLVNIRREPKKAPEKSIHKHKVDFLLCTA